MAKEEKVKVARVVFNNPPRGFEPEMIVPADAIRVENDQVFIKSDEGEVLVFPFHTIFTIIYFETEYISEEGGNSG